MTRKFANLEEIASTYPAVKRILGEDNINLEQNDIEMMKGDDWIQQGMDYLRFMDLPINSLILSLPLDQINILFNDVSGIAIPGSYFSALKVNFVSKNNQLTLLFQPIKLSYRHYDTNSLRHMYQISAQGRIWNFENNQLNTEKNNPDAYIRAYMGNISIQKDPANPGNYSRHSEGVDSLYMIFPFQLIYQLLHDNLSSALEFHNVAIGLDSPEKAPVFHSLILKSAISGSGPFVPGIFTDKYADRSHLCPPCTGFYYGFTRE